MKTLRLILAIAMFPVAMYSGTITEDTITAGNWNDYHPSFSRTGLYLNTDDEWLVFDRQTEVSMLASEECQPGMHERRWIAAGVASGMYFYRLQAGSYTETRKLMLLK